MLMIVGESTIMSNCYRQTDKIKLCLRMNHAEASVLVNIKKLVFQRVAEGLEGAVAVAPVFEDFYM